MIKKLLFLIIITIACENLFAQFGLYASAAYIQTNGINSFYNNTAPGLGQDIGTTNFQGTNLGVFEQNSGNLKLVGSEVKTFKSPLDNVCSATLNFTVYITGSRPVSPVFTAIDLGFFSDCFAPACGTFFGSYNLGAGGGCCSSGDQKWQSPGFGLPANIDLTSFVPGNYTLEVYYSYTGQDGGFGCGTTKYDNNNNNPVNYTAAFTITEPIPVRFGKILVSNKQQYNVISWETYLEEHTKKFILERASYDNTFYPVGEIPAAGFSSTLKNYSLSDLKPMIGVNYYRVKMIQTDGKYQISKVVKTNNNQGRNWFIANNPAKESIQLSGTETGDIIQLINLAGTILYTGKSNGPNTIIPVQQITNGMYFIKVIDKLGTNVTPVLISH